MLKDPTPDFLDHLRARLGPKGWRDGADAAPYLEEQRQRFTGRAGLVLTPAATEEVADIVRACAAAKVAIVPYAGGTGLVGGQISPDGAVPVVLSVERMRAIRALDPLDGAMTVEAGAILADVRAEAERAGRLFPLSLASEGSARIGGLLATNAGGIGVLRYGNARDLTLGIEAVLPDGSVLNGLSPLRKNNTGYDLRHLLIGAEGTLGVITAATLKLSPRPRELATAFLTVRDPAAAVALLSHLRDRVGETISAFELLCRQGMAFLAAHVPEAPAPPVAISDWHVMVETGGGAGAGAALEAALAEAFGQGLAMDGAIAQTEAQRAAFWALRELTPEANRRIGSVSSHDVSTPVGRIPEFIREAGRVIAGIDPSLRINCFGHVGDGNLHYNVFPAEGRARREYLDIRDEVKRAVHDLVHAFGGSISAEHGIGRLKVGDLARYGDPAKLAAMRAIKTALDPQGIMNPGAVLPPAAEQAAEDASRPPSPAPSAA